MLAVRKAIEQVIGEEVAATQQVITESQDESLTSVDKVTEVPDSSKQQPSSLPPKEPQQLPPPQLPPVAVVPKKEKLSISRKKSKFNLSHRSGDIPVTRSGHVEENKKEPKVLSVKESEESSEDEDESSDDDDDDDEGLKLKRSCCTSFISVLKRLRGILLALVTAIMYAMGAYLGYRLVSLHHYKSTDCAIVEYVMLLLLNIILIPIVDIKRRRSRKRIEKLLESNQRLAENREENIPKLDKSKIKAQEDAKNQNEKSVQQIKEKMEGGDMEKQPGKKVGQKSIQKMDNLRTETISVTQTSSVWLTVWPFWIKGRRVSFTYMVLRAVMSCIALIMQLYAMEFLTPADVTVFLASSPVFVALGARIFLKESCGVVQVILALVAITGVFIVSKPPFIVGGASLSTDHLIGISLALGSTITTSAASLFIRLAKNVHFTVMNLIAALIGVLAAIGVALCHGDLSNRKLFKASAEEYLLFLVIGGVIALGMTTNCLAFQYEAAGPISIVRSSMVIFTFLFQMMSDIWPDAVSVAGATLVLVSIILVGLRQYVAALPEHRKMRKKLWFLLK